jgi:hypothetical protein
LDKPFQSISNRLSVVALAVAALLMFAPITGQAASGSTGFRLELPNHERYTLTSTNDLTKLAQALNQLIRDEEEYLAQRKTGQKTQRTAMPLAEMSPAQLRSYFAEPLELPTNNELRGLCALQALCRQLQAASAPGERTNTMRLMVEVAGALKNLHRPPIPTRLEVTLMPVIFAQYLHRPVGKGTTVAANIHLPSGGSDSSRIDPPDSTFWKKPQAIAQADLFHCLGRSDRPDYENMLWEYAEPKTSFGSNPGFKLKHGDLELKAKFRELHSEPFTVRVFHTLGYNVEQTDYANSLRIKYDRRLVREFHQRKELDLHFRFLGVFAAGHVPVQKRYDPFRFITEAVLKDGARLTGWELKQRLLHAPEREHPEDDPANFDPAFEAKIDFLVTGAANVQLREAGVQNLGPWEFGGLGHEHLRELRGLAVLAAWLGWTDARFDNTRLKLVNTGDTTQVKHYFSDLGGGLGKGTGTFSWHSDEPNLFDWTFTKPLRRQGPGRMTIPFRIVNYRPINPVPAFEEMTLDDARWMARMIGQFTEEQIVQGLIATGWDCAEVRLLTEKLISRRDQMIVDLELAGEIPLLRPEGARRNLSYDPMTDGPIIITLPNGQKVPAPVTDKKVVAGRIVNPQGRR